MSVEHFLKQVQPQWDELGQLIAKAERLGIRALAAEELARLDRLYRVATVHLAQLRSRTQNPALTQSLSQLVSKAHSIVYVAPERAPWKRVLTFYLEGFPRAVARTRRYHAVALLLFAAGYICGYCAVMQRPLTAYALMMPGDTRLPGSSREQLEAVLRYGQDTPHDEQFVFASFLFTHNTKVAFLACATGVVAALPTVWLILITGGTLGAFVAVHHMQGVTTEMWAWILPHGVTELTGVILCGGAGLLLGTAVVRPGFLTRRQALLRAGREVVNIVLGVIPMFVLAGLAESYIRQSQLSTETRLAFAAGTAIFWLVYFVWGYGREQMPPWLAARRAVLPTAGSVRATRHTDSPKAP